MTPTCYSLTKYDLAMEAISIHLMILITSILFHFFGGEGG